jgi:hypothetical protein
MRNQNYDMDSSSKDKTHAPLIQNFDVMKQLNDQKNEITRLKTVNRDINKINYNKTFKEDEDEDSFVKDNDINRKLSIRDKIVLITLYSV